MNQRLTVAAGDALLQPSEQIHARGVISGINGIFGLAKVDGYVALRKLVTVNFDVREGDIDNLTRTKTFSSFPTTGVKVI